MDEEFPPMTENLNENFDATTAESADVAETAAEGTAVEAPAPAAAPVENAAPESAAPAFTEAPAPKAEDEEEEGVRFVDLGIDGRVLAALQDVGYEKPSPIQAATIPLLLEGRDVVG